jgi:hypothetical protein
MFLQRSGFKWQQAHHKIIRDALTSGSLARVISSVRHRALRPKSSPIFVPYF